MADEIKASPGAFTDEHKASTASHDTTRMWLGIITIIGLFAYIALITCVNVPNKELANVALGFLLGTAGSSVYGFYFGTSAGSQGKDETIQTLAEK